MATGFERHVGRCAFRISFNRRKRIDLGVRFTTLLMPAFADDVVATHDDTADARIRMRGETAAPRELHRARHETVIASAETGCKTIRHGHTP